MTGFYSPLKAAVLWLWGAQTVPMSEVHRFSLRKRFCALPAAEQVHCHLVVLWNDSGQVKARIINKWGSSRCICAGARAVTPMSKKPMCVKSNTTPAFPISSGSRLQKRIGFKKIIFLPFRQSPEMHPSQHSFHFTQRPHRDQKKWYKFGQQHEVKIPDNTGQAVFTPGSKWCSSHCPPTIKPSAAVWHTIKGIFIQFWLKPRITCTIQSPRTAHILWRSLFFFLRPALSSSEIVKIQGANINQQQIGNKDLVYK